MRTEVFADQPVDVSQLPSLRAEHFPYAGPYPWLDQANALEQIEVRVNDGRLTPSEAERCRFWNENGYIHDALDLRLFATAEAHRRANTRLRMGGL